MMRKVDENSCIFVDYYYMLKISNRREQTKYLSEKIIGENNSDKFILQEILEFKLPSFILKKFDNEIIKSLNPLMPIMLIDIICKFSCYVEF